MLPTQVLRNAAYPCCAWALSETWLCYWSSVYMCFLTWSIHYLVARNQFTRANDNIHTKKKKDLSPLQQLHSLQCHYIQHSNNVVNTFVIYCSKKKKSAIITFDTKMYAHLQLEQLGWNSGSQNVVTKTVLCSISYKL